MHISHLYKHKSKKNTYFLFMSFLITSQTNERKNHSSLFLSPPLVISKCTQEIYFFFSFLFFLISFLLFFFFFFLSSLPSFVTKQNIRWKHLMLCFVVFFVSSTEGNLLGSSGVYSLLSHGVGTQPHVRKREYTPK